MRDGERVFDLGMFLQRPLGFLVGNAFNLLRDDCLLGTKPCKLRLLARDLKVVAKCIELLVEVCLDVCHLLLGFQVDLVAFELSCQVLLALDLVL